MKKKCVVIHHPVFDEREQTAQALADGFLYSVKQGEAFKGHTSDYNVSVKDVEIEDSEFIAGKVKIDDIPEGLRANANEMKKDLLETQQGLIDLIFGGD